MMEKTNNNVNRNFISICWIGVYLRTFELSTSQAVLLDKVERLEMQSRLLEEKLSEMADSDEEIMKQHEKLFQKLDQGNTGYSYN